MIKYSPVAARALGYLKRFYNDLDIYVEDTASQSMWVRILEAVVPSHLRIASVNMLGGRDAVLKACGLDQADDGRRKLYVIDADFDFLLGRKKPKLKHLYRLRAYCVENLLISERSLTEVSLDCDGSISRIQAIAKVDFNVTIKQCGDMFRKLFCIYATAHALNSGIRTTKFSVRKLFRNVQNSLSVSPEKVFLRCKEIIVDLCKRYRASVVARIRKEISTRSMSMSTAMIVSGKDYLLPFIHVYLCKKCGLTGTPETLKARLAREYTPDLEPYFARRIRSLA